ncbi:MAG: M23 family metallopeptidase [Bacteroidetes bacterium]|jgi:peptidoglycan LD-endopeptidase LytH|nr:M23 family metallopeptidase [Bacteroidota bacterium]MBT4399675.1 M23 family metallopeptidase [Bacteroidota bacterium]MBT4409562.1 M23 family metallopeptidase [Bacteroidota bacterium]MBT7464210.1 M23 family metallopeptidase [Bacteroidota bacterium]
MNFFPQRRSGLIPIFVLLFFLLFGCKPEKVPQEFIFSNAHEAYMASLESAGLLNTALGRDWKSLSFQSLENPVNIELPFLEQFLLDSALPGSAGYRFLVKRGQKIEIDIDFSGKDSTLLFIDLFREKEDNIIEWHPVGSASKGELLLQYESRRDNYYILRIQPELLRGGTFELRIIEKPSLKFPVLGHGRRDIGSFFNEPRDGGRRKHHGVDIFASRHTAVLAPARAWVNSVGESDIGGRHVWLLDGSRTAYYYFAHLQEIKVSEKVWVNLGDTIGTVGNTGNARTTPPHLHFGIYLQQLGPVDPLAWILKTDTSPDKITNQSVALCSNKIVSEPIRMSYHLTGNGDFDSLLSENTRIKVLGKFSDSFRIQLENSLTGIIDLEDLMGMSQ